MIYNYNGLWTLMEKRKISKDALKKKMSLSSATIARMTAGQPVGLEIIGRLCDEFNCNSNDILLIEPEHAQKPWQRIEQDVLYKIFMYFYIPTSAQDDVFTATYLYGYAAPDNYKTNWRAVPATRGWHSREAHHVRTVDGRPTWSATYGHSSHRGPYLHQ